MSQLFDALRMCEAERSGIDPTKLADAAELLEIAERQAVEPATEAENRPEYTSASQFSHFQPVPVQLSSESNLVCVTDEGSLAAEKFRFLGVRLRHLQQKRPLKSVLITSSMSEEGKSMVAANLACSLAKKQQKILLLDGDLRRSTLAGRLGIGQLPGLSEWLHGDSETAIPIYQLETLGCWILPAGSPNGNPLELLQSEKLPKLMERLADWFDWIVIDSPPVMPLADTSIWMRLADGILLVTRPGRTSKRHLQRALEAIEQPKLLGALLNGSEEAVLGDYYQYYARETSSMRKAIEVLK